jgi:nicotinamidase/pyrazinamidase
MTDVTLAGLGAGDALLVVDLQHDSLPGGALGVAHGDATIAPINRLIGLFTARGLPVFASRDWHPPDHCSFREQGAPCPLPLARALRGELAWCRVHRRRAVAGRRHGGLEGDAA